jgi:hypothetical protein
MSIILGIHRIFGEMVLPLLIVVAAIWLTVSWKPNSPPNAVARLFPVLVDIQVLLGLIFWVFGIVQGNGAYLSFPFILHPILGLLAAGFAHRALKGGPFRGLGRWAPLASLGVLLILVIANVAIALAAV